MINVILNIINDILNPIERKKTMRKIDMIIIHCSATPPNMLIGADSIREWHLKRGFKDIGYSDVIKRDGTEEEGRPLNQAGAHTKGYNKHSIGICMVGGVDENGKPDNNFTDKQWRSLERLIRYYKAQYPKATIHGHNEFANKACPSFDVQEWLRKVNLN